MVVSILRPQSPSVPGLPPLPPMAPPDSFRGIQAPYGWAAQPIPVEPLGGNNRVISRIDAQVFPTIPDLEYIAILLSGADGANMDNLVHTLGVGFSGPTNLQQIAFGQSTGGTGIDEGVFNAFTLVPGIRYWVALTSVAAWQLGEYDSTEEYLFNFGNTGDPAVPPHLDTPPQTWFTIPTKDAAIRVITETV